MLADVEDDRPHDPVSISLHTCVCVCVCCAATTASLSLSLSASAFFAMATSAGCLLWGCLAGRLAVGPILPHRGSPWLNNRRRPPCLHRGGVATISATTTSNTCTVLRRPCTLWLTALARTVVMPTTPSISQQKSARQTNTEEGGQRQSVCVCIRHHTTANGSGARAAAKARDANNVADRGRERNGNLCDPGGPNSSKRRRASALP